MSDVLQQTMNEMIKKSMAGVEQAVGFMSAEIPDVIKQAMTWYMVENLIQCFFGLMIVFAATWFNVWQIKYWRKWLEENNNTWDDLPANIAFNIFQILLVFPIFILINLQWLKIWITPKLWLIEYAGKIISK